MIHTFVKGEPNWVDPLNANFQEVAAAAGEAIPASEKGAAGGVATLDSGGKLMQMPTAEDVGAMATNAVQSGSNSNGSWIKWPDGTMFCWAVGAYTVQNSEVSVMMPMPFSTSDYVPTISFHWVNTAAAIGAIRGMTVNGFSVRVSDAINDKTYDNGTQLTMSYIAIGRWK